MDPRVVDGVVDAGIVGKVGEAETDDVRVVLGLSEFAEKCILFHLNFNL